MTKAKNFQFDWRTLPFEQWRGPGLSFPIAVDLIMVPEFDELVIAAVDTFPKYDLVPHDAVSVLVLHEWERGEDGEAPFNDLGPSDLGLRLHYFEGDYQNYVMKLRDGSVPEELMHQV